jgi:hypothetical protein
VAAKCILSLAGAKGGSSSLVDDALVSGKAVDEGRALIVKATGPTKRERSKIASQSRSLSLTHTYTFSLSRSFTLFSSFSSLADSFSRQKETKETERVCEREPG